MRLLENLDECIRPDDRELDLGVEYLWAHDINALRRFICSEGPVFLFQRQAHGLLPIGAQDHAPHIWLYNQLTMATLHPQHMEHRGIPDSFYGPVWPEREIVFSEYSPRSEAVILFSHPRSSLRDVFADTLDVQVHGVTKRNGHIRVNIYGISSEATVFRTNC